MYREHKCQVIHEGNLTEAFQVHSGVQQPKRDEVTGEWRKLHNEELNGLYSLPNIVWVIKLRRLRWAGHVAHMGEGCVQGSGGET
jgi:hypothetical protein